MSDSSSSSSSGGLGCLWIPLSVILFGTITTAWFWSQGITLQAAVAQGIIWGSGITGMLCGGLCLFFALVIIIAALAGTRSRY